MKLNTTIPTNIRTRSSKDKFYRNLRAHKTIMHKLQIKRNRLEEFPRNNRAIE